MLVFFKWRGARGKRFYCFATLFCLMAGFSGCAKPQLTVKIAIVPEANGNSPVAVDLVRVTEKDLAKEIAKLTAADWFQKREQYRRDYSKPGVLIVDSQEWIPGQPVPSFKIPAPLPLPIISAHPTMVIFANYFTPGPHRAILQPHKVSTIHLGADDLTVVVDKK